MKNLFFFLFAISLSMSSCVSCLKPIVEARLTTLPTPPHQRPVKIFFPGEPLPATPYVQIKVLSVRRGANYPTTNLVQELAARAQREGADAILVFGRHLFTETKTTTTTTVDSSGSSTSSSTMSDDWQDLSALAIKYLTELDYLSDYVREQRLLHWYSGAWQPVATGQVAYEAPTQWQPATNPWLKVWQAYDPASLLSERERTHLATHDGVDGLRVTKWFSGPSREHKYRYHQREDGRIESAEVKISPNGGGRSWIETIRYEYDAAGHLTGRVLDTREWGSIHEKQLYDASGKPVAVEWTRANQPFLRLELEYYRPEDVPRIMR